MRTHPFLNFNRRLQSSQSLQAEQRTLHLRMTIGPTCGRFRDYLPRRIRGRIYIDRSVPSPHIRHCTNYQHYLHLRR